jgi:GMP synthase (glutamine-hydrolysing)
MQEHRAQIWIVDFGSQYTQLIARKVRELKHSSVIVPWEKAQAALKAKNFPAALILSGGPGMVGKDPTDYSILTEVSPVPILGICYGMQILAQVFGGAVQSGKSGEYGDAEVEVLDNNQHLPSPLKVWMSHGDQVTVVPSSFKVWMRSPTAIAAIKHQERLIWGVQFHPEVEHTPQGKELLAAFLQAVHLKEDWDTDAMRAEALQVLADIEEPVLCAFSGGVDSLVAATLAQQTQKNLVCFFVDNGLLRPQDLGHIAALQKATSLPIKVVAAQDLFLNNLQGVNDPEQKRKIIGKTFIDVFEAQVRQYEQEHHLKFKYLLQGTLYPDVIESHSPFAGGKSVTIKSHHNVGGLPAKMQLDLLEPLKFLFKDEVRQLGLKLGLKQEWVFRHPFPGPGIGVRVLGEVRPKLVAMVQQADQILFELLHKYQLYAKVWQAFPVLIPQRTVGVKGDARAYEYVMALRIINSSDGMTARWAVVDPNFLAEVSSRITNEVAGITRVVYDITHKPPATIEWE